MSVGNNSNVVIGEVFLNNLAHTISVVNEGNIQIADFCKDDGSESQTGNCFNVLNDLANKIHVAVSALLDGLDLKIVGTSLDPERYDYSACI